MTHSVTCYQRKHGKRSADKYLEGEQSPLLSRFLLPVTGFSRVHIEKGRWVTAAIHCEKDATIHSCTPAESDGLNAEYECRYPLQPAVHQRETLVIILTRVEKSWLLLYNIKNNKKNGSPSISRLKTQKLGDCDGQLIIYFVLYSFNQEFHQDVTDSGRLSCMWICSYAVQATAGLESVMIILILEKPTDTHCHLLHDFSKTVAKKILMMFHL